MIIDGQLKCPACGHAWADDKADELCRGDGDGPLEGEQEFECPECRSDFTVNVEPSYSVDFYLGEAKLVGEKYDPDKDPGDRCSKCHQPLKVCRTWQKVAGELVCWKCAGYASIHDFNRATLFARPTGGAA